MSKYPCGKCSIGVKHKGILCTGPCKLWHHSKCLGWTDKMLKNLTKPEVEKWRCKNCAIAQVTPPETNIEEIEQKISKIEDLENNDLETSLSLAAEVGNALLIENQELKQNVFDLKLKNSKLTLEIQDLKSKMEKSEPYPQHVEELNDEKEAILSKYNMIVNKLNNTENQLVKEKQLRESLQKIFEEQDKEKEEIILNDKITIKNLKCRIEQLLEKINNIKDQSVVSVTSKNADTQTSNDIAHNTNTPQIYDSLKNSFLLTELSKLQLRQDKMESLLENFQSQLEDIKKENKGLKSPPEKQQGQENPKKEIFNKKNHFSASLKLSKYKEACNKQETELQLPLSGNVLQTLERQYSTEPNKTHDEPRKTITKPIAKFKVTVGPPITASKRKDTETIKEFFERSLTESGNNVTVSNYFLDTLQQKKTREKKKTGHKETIEELSNRQKTLI